MADIFTLRTGDRAPWLAYQFPFSLADAVSVSLSARDATTQAIFIDNQPAIIADGTYVINGEEVTLTPADGVVFYPWGPSDTTTQRKSALGLFHITWPGNLVETMPSEGYERFAILDNF
jgi:hypothetical protein